MHRPFARRRLLTGLVLLGTAAAALLLPTTPAASTVTTECPPGLKVRPSNSPRTILVRDTATDERLRVRVTLTGPSFTIEPVGRDVLDDASWCLKAGKRFETGTGTEGTTTLTNKNGVPLADPLPGRLQCDHLHGPTHGNVLGQHNRERPGPALCRPDQRPLQR